MSKLERVLCIAALLATPGCDQPETDLGDRSPEESQGTEEVDPHFPVIASFNIAVEGSPTTLGLSEAGSILVGTASLEPSSAPVSAGIYLYDPDGALEHELKSERQILLEGATWVDGHWFVIAEAHEGAPGQWSPTGVFELLDVDDESGSMTTRGQFACGASCDFTYDARAEIAWTVKSVEGRAQAHAFDLDGNELGAAFECGAVDFSLHATTRTDGGIAVWNSDGPNAGSLTACSRDGVALWSHTYENGAILRRHDRDGAFELLVPPATGASAEWTRTRITESGELLELPSFTEPEGTLDVLAGGLGRLLLFGERQLGEVLESGDVELGPLPAEVQFPQFSVRDSRFAVLSDHEEFRNAAGVFGLRGVLSVLEHPEP